MDFAILDFIQEHIRCGFLDAVMPVITILGTAYAVAVITMILIAVKKTRRIGIEALIGLLIKLVIINLILKNLVARDRPCWINKSIDMLVKIPKDYSFPSGHSGALMLLATVITCHNKKAGIPVMIMAFIVMFSRLYLYVHFPTDVAAGALIGVTIAMAVVYGTKTYLKKHELKICMDSEDKTANG